MNFDNYKFAIMENLRQDGISLSWENFLDYIKEIGLHNEDYINWLLDNYSFRIITRYENLLSFKTVLFVYDVVMNNYDHYVNLVAKNNREKDFFDKHMKDITKVDANTLYYATNHFNSFVLKNEKPYKIKKEIKIIKDDKEGKIIVPLSERALSILGQNTKWFANNFNFLNEQGDVYVFVENDKKYFLSFEIGMLIDSENKPIKGKPPKIISEFMNNLPYAEKLKCAFQNIYSNNIIQYLNLKEEDMFLLAKTYRRFLVNKTIALSDENKLKLTEYDSSYFNIISGKNYELCLKAVSLNGNLINQVPKQLIDNNLIEKAFLNKPSSMKFMSHKKLTKNFIINLINKDFELIKIFEKENINLNKLKHKELLFLLGIEKNIPKNLDNNKILSYLFLNNYCRNFDLYQHIKNNDLSFWLKFTDKIIAENIFIQNKYFLPETHKKEITQYLENKYGSEPQYLKSKNKPSGKNDYNSKKYAITKKKNIESIDYYLKKGRSKYELLQRTYIQNSNFVNYIAEKTTDPVLKQYFEWKKQQNEKNNDLKI